MDDLAAELQKMCESELYVGISGLFFGGIEISVNSGELTGRVSNIAGVLPWLQEAIGKHYPESRYQIERMRGVGRQVPDPYSEERVVGGNPEVIFGNGQG